jgi:hypothetical protein
MQSSTRITCPPSSLINMKKLILALALLGMTAHLGAVQITGSLTIAGGATLDGPLATANQVSTWVNPEVESRSGSFVAFTAVGQSVTMTQPWVFDPSGPQAALWSVGGFTFNLASSSIALQDANFLIVSGLGTIVGNSFDPTPGVWRFSTQAPDAQGVFSFSASTAANPSVPDGGSSVALLGLAIAAIAVVRRKLK